MSNRTQNSIKNVKTSFILQLVNKLTSFIVRTVFIYTLNVEYLGVNGLFSNILTILSFAELGIGTAIIYNMYKPIATNDEEKVKSLMLLYKKSYTYIGIIVFLLGLLLIPFLGILVTDVPKIKEGIVLIYVLFLINTSFSYFYSYNKSILLANQKQSVINEIDCVLYLIKCLFNIVILIIFKNYILYLLIEILFTVFENIYVSKVAIKMYPNILNGKAKKLSKKENKEIFSNVKSLVIYKLGTVIMTGTDNILISLLVNVASVGLCSNYNLIISSVNAIINSSLNGVVGSIGNLNAIESIEKKETVFYQLTFIYFFLYSVSTILLIVLLNPFIELWLGEKYVLEISISFALAISFFIAGMREPGYIYRTTLGMFNKSKVTPYIGASVNIVLSIILCKYFGLVGIFIATSIAQLVSYSWIDPYLVHKYEFKTSVRKYLKKYLTYCLIFVLELFVCILISNYSIFSNVYVNFIYKAFVSLVIPVFLNIIIFGKTSEFQNLYQRFVKPIIKKIIKEK